MSQKKILIVTPHSDFGEIVSQSLGKEASCDVIVATSLSEAITQTRKSQMLNYALLDMEMGVEKVLEQGFTLRNSFPAISIILISKKYPPPEMEDLRPWKFLRKPFVQRELMELIRDGSEVGVFNPGYVDSNFATRAEDTVPAWYMDETIATRNLVAATSNLVVQEAMLVSNTGVLAHSGELSKDAVEECSRLVRRYWGNDSTADLIKPVRLQTTSKNHLLSATVLAVGIILALTFDGETPFDILRSQTRYLTGVLKNPRLSMPEVHILPRNAEEALQVTKKPFISDDFEITRTSAAAETLTDIVNAKGESAQAEPAPAAENPQVEASRNPDVGELTTTPPALASEGTAAPESQTAWTGPTQPQPGDLFSQTSFVVPESRPVEAGSPINVTGEPTRSSLGPTESSMYNVYYSCVLIPRIQTHELDQEFASFLNAELPNIFMAYGWRLEQVVVGRGYIQWVVRIPPTLAPASHIKVIRRENSKLILEHFAKFNGNEFLRDFWSPGYLLGGGRHLIPEAEIAEFARMNRKQYYSQGGLHIDPKRDPLNYRF
jgi:CheY-like chemotaxis protein